MSYCLICGARIGDNNPDGLGCECRAALHTAQLKRWYADEDHVFERYRMKSQPIRNLYLEIFANVKFRSEFRKSFYESIKNSDRVSRKQLEVMRDMLCRKDVDSLIRVDKEIKDRLDDYRRYIFENCEVTRAEIEAERREIRKSQKRGDAEVEE